MENIDTNFGQIAFHNRHQILQKYSFAFRQLQKLAEFEFEVRPFNFENFVLLHYFDQRVTENEQQTSETSASGTTQSSLLAHFKLELLQHILDRRRQIMYWLFYIFLLAACVFAYRLESSTSGSSSSERSLHYVNPGMRLWRRMTLPLIQRFPRLTELYDESCLMENPFFQVDLPCEPCAAVESVLDLTQQEDEAENQKYAKLSKDLTDHVPFVFKINQSHIELNDFYNIYANNQEIFQRDAYRVQSTNRDVTNLEELFAQFNHTQTEQTHSLWRCNRMLPARLLRQLFAGPSRLPSMGVALERFIAVDTAQAPTYTMPQTECANVYVQQATGSRFIILRPTSECRHSCRTLSLRLPESFVLSYNWWYWKPISAPDPIIAQKLSISLIGSYC